MITQLQMQIFANCKRKQFTQLSYFLCSSTSLPPLVLIASPSSLIYHLDFSHLLCQTMRTEDGCSDALSSVAG